MEACNALATASHAPTAQPSCIPPGWLLRFFTKFFVIHVLVLHSFLSPCAKRDLFPGNIVDIRGNDTRGTEVLLCSRDETRPLDARRSNAHLCANTFDNWCGFHAALPRFLPNNRPVFRIYPLYGMFFRTGTLAPKSSLHERLFLFVRLCTLQHGVKAYMIVWILAHSTHTHTF